MKRKAIMLAAILLLTLPSLALADLLPFGGVVSIDTVGAQPGESVAVPIRLSSNDLAFTGMQVPMDISSPSLVFDSVSFIGSVAPGTPSYFVNAESHILQVDCQSTWFPFETFHGADGLLATIHFTVDAAAPLGIIPVDSVDRDVPYYDSTSGGTVLRQHSVTFVDADGWNSYYPDDFIPGAIVVRVPTGIDDDAQGALPSEFGLSQNYPNPFNPVTQIEFALPSAGHARLEVFNVLGQNVATPVDGVLSSGVHSVEFNAGQHPSGIYFYRLSHENKSETRKMILLK